MISNDSRTRSAHISNASVSPSNAIKLVSGSPTSEGSVLVWGDRFGKFKLTSAQTLFGCNTNLTADYSDIIGDVTICGASRDNRGI